MEKADGQILSVSELTAHVRLVLEGSVPELWLRGEVSNLRRQSSGHVYFSLKDAESQINCVLFRGEVARQSVRLEDGMQVLAFGRISVYPPRGSYQWVVRELLPDGVGRLQQAFEALKQKLSAEGLFDPARKRPLPLLAQTVGVITSPTGAALRDFVSILRRRGWRGRLVVLPARVQGAEAGGELVAQLERAARMGVFDVLVLTRGGGSLEDLWPFNEEALVRAVAASPVPVISGVGHEIDFTLCDFAADKRAETPSGAAEWLSSAQLEVRERLARLGEALVQGVAWELERLRGRVEGLTGRLRACAPQQRLEYLALKLDELAGRFERCADEALTEGHQALALQERGLRLCEPSGRLRTGVLALEGMRGRFERASTVANMQLGRRLEQVAVRLEAAHYPSVLRRGFSVVRDARGKILTRAAELKDGQWLTHEFADGQRHSRVMEPDGKPRSPGRSRSEDTEQIELF